MDEQPPVRSRRPVMWIAAIAGVVVGIAVAVAAAVLLNRAGDDPAAPATPTAGPDTCADNGWRDQLVVRFLSADADEQMRQAAERLRGEAQVAALATETRQRAYERFVEVFGEKQPELVRLARPEALPASVWVLPADNVEIEQLASQLRGELPGADEVRTDVCRMPTAPPTT